jgi:hypothetical protein
MEVAMLRAAGVYRARMRTGRSRSFRRSGTGLLAVGLLVTVAAACSSGSGRSAASTTTATSSTSRVASPTIPPPAPPVDWTKVRNPIVQSADHAVKDPALVAVNGKWFAAFSSVDAKGTWRIGIEHSSDLVTWSAMTFMPHDPAIEGEASPDIVRASDGKFVITYQSFVHDVRGGLAKLYYRTTSDFVHFSAEHRLLEPLFSLPSDRLIDPALAWTPTGLLLGFKTGNTDSTQAFEIARSSTGSLDGPWQIIGKPDIRVFGDTIENYEFIEIDGRWKLIATSNLLDRPFLFNLLGDPRRPQGWLRWSAGQQLDVPKEAWNPGTGITGSTYEHANSAYLVDHRSRDNFFYLVYEDAPEMTTFGGEGHGVLAVARSTDLVHWSVPPN